MVPEQVILVGSPGSVAIHIYLSSSEVQNPLIYVVPADRFNEVRALQVRRKAPEVSSSEDWE